MNPSTPKLKRVFVVGASLTIQFGPYLEKELAGKFSYDRKRATDGKRAEDDLDVPQGASGGDSSMVLKYLQFRRQNDPIPADILLLAVGLHDIKTHPKTGDKQVPLDRYEANLKAIVNEAAAMNLTIAWLRIAPVIDDVHNGRPNTTFLRFARDVASYNAVADRVMNDAGAFVIDFHAFCSTLLPDAVIDHIHYNEDGRHKQAVFIAQELEKRFLAPAG